MTLDEERHISQWRTPTFIIKRTTEASMKATNKSFKAEFKVIIGTWDPAIEQPLKYYCLTEEQPMTGDHRGADLPLYPLRAPCKKLS